MDRREFMKAIAAVSAATLTNPKRVFAGQTFGVPGYFELHQFIETHSDSVFIKYTNVSSKTNEEAKKTAGIEFAQEILSLRDTPGIPLSYRIAIKPNLTCTSGTAATEKGMGIITDCFFVEGMIEGLKGLGISEENIYMREGNWLGDSYCPSECSINPYVDMAEHTGVHLLDFPTGRNITQLSLNTLEEGSEVTWIDCPDGIVFKRIGCVAPFNQPDTWLMNIAKYKTHGMGMTLCVKNLQGMCIHPYIHFCEGVDKTKSYPSHILENFQSDLEEHIEELHVQHLLDGIPRWDRPGRDWNSGYGMEMWAQRICDLLSVTNVGLNIIEGIYSRNGNGFLGGPGPNGEAQDFMTNILIFGKNPFMVDIIGNWLGGHEPGNFGLFHIAKERGLCNTINPMSIPIYLWEEGIPKPISLLSLTRTPLVTYYLQQNYGGRNEPFYHLVDEYYCYEESPNILVLNIPLKAGWNLISTPSQLPNDNISTALQSIAGRYSCLWTYNATESKWKRYSPDTPDFLNNLQKIELGKGYWLQMLEPAILTLEGMEIVKTPLSLKRGWNLIGYTCKGVKPIGEALSSIAGNYSSVWTYDALEGEWKRCIVNGPISSSNLEIMEPGKGYYVDVMSDCMLSIC